MGAFVNLRGANREIVHGTMLVGCAMIVAHLLDSLEKLIGAAFEFLSLGFRRFRNRRDQRRLIERIKLIENNDRKTKSIAHFGGRDRTADADNDIDVVPTMRAKRIYQHLIIGRVTRLQNVSLQRFDT